MGIVWPLAGGLLIGLSAATYLLLTGRIAGISGLLSSALGMQPGGSRRLGLGFVAGLLLGSAAAMAFLRQPQILIEASTPLLVAGGLLVGFGTRWGSGCTSGHGVCGLARLSPRSVVATLTFMGVAALTVFVMRHLLGAGA
ncbi:YeeE/YedE family protein [Pseudomarimonas salicorniae]|uniref:YeeE/YedE family protein n=1 Tax=Pseudomarimonas salicorniae TaxID=2933270 RepID=A0ABT0GM14_9GAMM|nr:YeeE/YedE family protein [Lysobacter sp. CAU 1642]